jgi:hypothetical protein
VVLQLCSSGAPSLGQWGALSSPRQQSPCSLVATSEKFAQSWASIGWEAGWPVWFACRKLVGSEHAAGAHQQRPPAVSWATVALTNRSQLLLTICKRLSTCQSHRKVGLNPASNAFGGCGTSPAVFEYAG